MAVARFSIGTIAQPVFCLGFVEVILAILFFNILGILPTSFSATLGHVLGLRQLVLLRFYFSWYSVKLYAFFDILTCLGWLTLQIMLNA